MILLAIALAQRDARHENKLAGQPVGSFQPKKAQGIQLDPDWENQAWPPAPVIRGNDTPIGTATQSNGKIAKDRNNPFRSPSAALTAFSNQNRSGALAEPPPLQYRPLSGSNSLSRSTVDSPNDGAANGLMPMPPAGLATATPPGLIGSGSNPASDSLENSLPELPTASGYQPNVTPPADSLPTTLPSYGAPPSYGAKVPGNESLPPLPGPIPAQSPFSNSPGAPAALQDAPKLPASLATSADLAPTTVSTPATAPATAPAPATVRMQAPQLEGSNYAPSGLGNRISDSTPVDPVPPSMPPVTNKSIELELNGDSPNALRSSGPTTSTSTSSSPAGLGEVHAVGPFRAFTSPSPGIRQLEGAQNPNIEIQKRAPAEVQVGLPATVTLLVRNVGNATAFDVRVSDSVPKGAKLTRTNPEAKSDAQGNLVWELGQFKAGAEQVLTMEIVPETEGELGSVASVQFSAQASVRTMSTLPKLLVKQTIAPSVLGGDSEVIKIDVVNNGTGTARNVRLEAEIPPNMRHASGSTALDTDGIDLAPGDSFQMELELTAVAAGPATSRVKAVSDNAAPFESTATIDVIQPKLDLSIEGPRLRYLERQATYKVQVQNTGNAMAKGIRLVVYLPRGLQFNSAANDGTYFPEQHSVEWYLEELNAGRSALTELSVLPIQEGDFVLRMHGTAERVRADAIDKKVQVEGQSELAFSVADDNDPIERDGSTTYIIQVANSGTKPDADVSLVVELPEGASAEQIHAPVNYQVQGKLIVFEPIPTLQPREQQSYRVSVRHSREGVLVIKTQIKSRNRPVSVIKEESTEVYVDQ
jgi:uncharacterized repeat protein (TIGR01451 family)